MEESCVNNDLVKDEICTPTCFPSNHKQVVLQQWNPDLDHSHPSSIGSEFSSDDPIQDKRVFFSRLLNHIANFVVPHVRKSPRNFSWRASVVFVSFWPWGLYSTIFAATEDHPWIWPSSDTKIPRQDRPQAIGPSESLLLLAILSHFSQPSPCPTVRKMDIETSGCISSVPCDSIFKKSLFCCCEHTCTYLPQRLSLPVVDEVNWHIHVSPQFLSPPDSVFQLAQVRCVVRLASDCRFPFRCHVYFFLHQTKLFSDLAKQETPLSWTKNSCGDEMKAQFINTPVPNITAGEIWNILRSLWRPQLRLDSGRDPNIFQL